MCEIMLLDQILEIGPLICLKLQMEEEICLSGKH